MKGPGALSCQTVQNMSKYLLTAQGLPVAPREGALPAICLQYHRQVLAGRLSPPLARESLNICSAADAMLEGQPALCLDVLLQRLKSVEALGGGADTSRSIAVGGSRGGLVRCKRRWQQQQQEQVGRLQRKREARQRGKGQEGQRKGEGQINSPLGTLSEQAIEAELRRIDREVNDGKQMEATDAS